MLLGSPTVKKCADGVFRLFVRGNGTRFFAKALQQEGVKALFACLVDK